MRMVSHFETEVNGKRPDSVLAISLKKAPDLGVGDSDRNSMNLNIRKRCPVFGKGT
jgi:hypothetical protein